MPAVIGDAERVQPRFLSAVPCVRGDQQGDIEKNLLRLGVRHVVLVVLACVSCIPVEASNQGKIKHFCILLQYTYWASATAPGTMRGVCPEAFQGPKYWGEMSYSRTNCG